LQDHFQVIPDATSWGRSYIQTAHGKTPMRERATFRQIQQVLHPVTEVAHNLDKATGLYMLAFDLPSPALYVGIAAEAKSPEGILSRLRKHCIKAMGANVGNPGSTGGVHHPQKWAKFAVQRHAFFNGNEDVLSDVRFVTAQSSNGNNKFDLQNFEHQICNNTDQVLDSICTRLWEGKSSQDVCLLTSGTVHPRGELDCHMILW